MNAFTNLSGVSGLEAVLELAVVNRIDFENIGHKRLVHDLTQTGEGGLPLAEQFQRDVFEEQGVTHIDDRILRVEDLIGTPEHPGSLDGSSRYHAFFLFNGNQLIGMSASERIKIEGIGAVIMEYLPPLVKQEDADTAYTVKLPELVGKPRAGSIQTERMTPVEIMRRFTRHIRHPDRLMARFTDGIGISERHLREMGYLKAEATIWVPPLDASTKEGYETVLEAPVSMYGLFSQFRKPRLNRMGTVELMIGRYLKE